MYWLFVLALTQEGYHRQPILNGYWVKEGVFRQIRKRLAEARLEDPGQAPRLNGLERDLTRLYYTGRFPEYVARITDVPSQ